MRVLRVVVAMSTLALSMSFIEFAAAQAPATNPATAKSEVAKPAAAAEPSTADEGPVPASPFPAGPPSKGGLELNAIHKADRVWREQQRGYQRPGTQDRVQLAVLRSVDPATQQKSLEHFESVKAQLDKLSTDGMSEAEKMNLEIYLYQIDTQIAGQKFKEYEKPVNSLESFWMDVQGTGERGFRTEQSYENFLLWMAEDRKSVV